MKRILLIFFLSIIFSGCAGGSQGTGVRIDRQLVDNPPLDDDLESFSSLFSLSSTTPESCEFLFDESSIEAKIITEFGNVQTNKDSQENCQFIVPYQATKLALSVSNWSQSSNYFKYTILEQNCGSSNEKVFIKESVARLVNDVATLPKFQLEKGKRYNLIIFLEDTYQPTITLQLISDATNHCN